MDTALNRYGKEIRAQHATRGERYQCPECKTRVKFIPDGLRIAHFKHLPISTLSAPDQLRCESCSRYITDRGGGLHEPSPPRTPVRPPTRAVLAVGWSKTAVDPERWSLYVSVPIPPSSVEDVWVEGNINGGVWLPRRVVEKHRYVPVRVATKQYQVTCRAKASGTAPVIQPTGLLEGRCANVFAAGTGGGVQLEPGEPLVRGNCYFTLSQKPGVWTAPPGNTSRGLSGSKDCDPSGVWEGHLLYVPRAPDSRFAAWCQRVCERSVVPPPANLELVYPPLVDTRPDGTLVIPHGEEVFLALRGEWEEPEIELWRDDEATSPTVERLAVAEGDLITLRNLPVGLYSIYATESSRALVRIEVARVVEPTIPTFTIRTTDRATGSELQGDFHEPDGTVRWSGLMSGTEGWVGIDFPAGWLVEVVSRFGVEIQDRRQSVRSPMELTKLVAECLAAEPLVARLDAGVFGAANWEAPKPVAPPKRSTKAISQQMRQRLEWLLANARRQNDAIILPVGVSILPGWESRIDPNDFTLVAKFLQTPCWPEPLLAHARVAAKDLRNHLKM